MMLKYQGITLTGEQELSKEMKVQVREHHEKEGVLIAELDIGEFCLTVRSDFGASPEQLATRLEGLAREIRRQCNQLAVERQAREQAA